MPFPKPGAKRKRSFRRGEFPQRLEVAVDGAAFTARVELVPFPKPARNGKSRFAGQHSPSGWKPPLIERRLRHEWNSS
ncbi:MAG: hypothetical protein WAM89_11445, partial [Terriglobales bacterium]